MSFVSELISVICMWLCILGFLLVLLLRELADIRSEVSKPGEKLSLWKAFKRYFIEGPSNE